MRILVTNDDGVDAPGIHALAPALVNDGHDVLVVAPTDDRSGAGAAIGRLWETTGKPPVEQREWAELPSLPVHAIDAPPGAAVLAACLGAFGDVPDLIVSGINPGANTGHLVLHSGTVGATLTGASYGVPGIAVSMAWSDDTYHWDTAAAVAVAAVEWAVKPDVVPRVLNVNVPNLPLAELKGVLETELAAHGEVWIVSADVSAGDLKLEIKGRAEASAGTDVAAVRDGYVSVTPLMSIVRSAAEGAATAVIEGLG